MASDNEASCESDPNFAVICAFMEKFGVTCGLAAIDFLGLQAMLENTTEVSQELVDLHIKLLRKSRKSVSTERWERAIVKFCHTFCMQDAWEIERFGYKKARLSSKLRVLKELLEMQFDYNVRFKQEINKMSSGDLRSQPIGKDNKGHAYWYQSDNNCQIRVYKEDPDEETWTLIANDREGLVALINDLKSGDEKRPPEPPPNEEDSNSLTEKPIIDTGQVDSSSDSTIKKISEESSENSNEANISEDDKKRARESDEEKENETKKAKSNEEKIVEKSDDAEEIAVKLDTNKNVSCEEIKEKTDEIIAKVDETNPTTDKVEMANEEKVIIETDKDDVVIEEKTKAEAEKTIVEENGKNEEVSEAIEEPLMLVKGEGNGKENECLNPPIVGEAIEEDLMFFYGCGSGYDCETGNDDKEEAASSTNNVSIKKSESKDSLNTIIDTKTDNNTSDDKNSTKNSKWDVETIIAKEEHEVSKKFFFGPPSSQISPATVGFGQKVPQVENEKGDIGYRIQDEKELNKIEEECVHSDSKTIGKEEEEEEREETKAESTNCNKIVNPVKECNETQTLSENTSQEEENNITNNILEIDEPDVPSETTKKEKVFKLKSLDEKISTKNNVSLRKFRRPSRNQDTISNDLENNKSATDDGTTESSKDTDDKIISSIEKQIVDDSVPLESNVKIPEVTAALLECDNDNSDVKPISSSSEEVATEEPIVEKECIKKTAYLLGEKEPPNIVNNHQNENVIIPIKEKPKIGRRRKNNNNTAASTNNDDTTRTTRRSSRFTKTNDDIIEEKPKPQETTKTLSLGEKETRPIVKLTKISNEKLNVIEKNIKTSDSESKKQVSKVEEKKKMGKTKSLGIKVRTSERTTRNSKAADTEKIVEKPKRSSSDSSNTKQDQSKNEKKKSEKILATREETQIITSELAVKSSEEATNSIANEDFSKIQNIKRGRPRKKVRKPKGFFKEKIEESEVASPQSVSSSQSLSKEEDEVSDNGKKRRYPSRRQSEDTGSSKAVSVANSPKNIETSIIVDSSGSSDDDVLEVPETDPLDCGPKSVTLSTFSLDFTEDVPTPVRSGISLRKRSREETPQNRHDKGIRAKKMKLKGRRTMDSELRKSIEEKKKQDLVSSDEDNNQQGDDTKTTIIISSDEEKKPRKPRGRRKRDENEKLLHLGIDISQIIVTGEDGSAGVRQSRRIAQQKIKEEAIRKEIEEGISNPVTEKKKRKSKKSEKFKVKIDKAKTEENEETTEEDDSRDSKKKKKKKRKHKPFDEMHPWRSSSDSSATEEEFEEEEVEEEEDEALHFASDHEFSPESDVEGDESIQPLKRARTAKKESDVEEKDDCPCQKCNKSDHPEWILLCDKCDNGWHCSCLRPPLLVIPEGDWFCPPCQHTRLLTNLEEKLAEYDKRIIKKQLEDRRKERLAYVGISLNNVLPAKGDKKRKKEKRILDDEEDDEDNDGNVKEDRDADAHIEDDGESDSDDEDESGSPTSSSSSTTEQSEDEPIYQLRQRRQAHSYRFTDYDELISSAIGEDIDAGKGAGNQGRGKDIATIVNANIEEEKELAAAAAAAAAAQNEEETIENSGEEKPPPVVPLHDKDKEAKPLIFEKEDNQNIGIIKIKKRLLGRRKHRKLNALDINSEDDDDEGSDEDFKGSSEESDDEFEDDYGSGDSELLESARRRRKGNDPVRRSTRARTSRYDADFIDDADSDDSNAASRRRKKRAFWYESSSTESDRSWGRNKRKAAARSHKKSNQSSTMSPSKQKKSKKKKKNEDSDVEVYRKKKPKIKYGLDDDDDEGPVRRTRGKKINYIDALGSDSDDEKVKRPPPRIESDEEYVADEEEKDGATLDAAAAQKNINDPSKIQIQSYTNATFTEILPDTIKDALLPEDLDEENPILQINRTLEMMDENEMEKLMEEEEYANKQLQLMAMQLEKEKRRKEREAKKIEEAQLAKKYIVDTNNTSPMVEDQLSKENRQEIGPPPPQNEEFSFRKNVQEPVIPNVENPPPVLQKEPFPFRRNVQESNMENPLPALQKEPPFPFRRNVQEPNVENPPPVLEKEPFPFRRNVQEPNVENPPPVLQKELFPFRRTVQDPNVECSPPVLQKESFPLRRNLQEPIVENLSQNSETNDELSEPPGVTLPLFSELVTTPSEVIESSNKKRKSRPRKTLEEAVANLGSVVRAQGTSDSFLLSRSPKSTPPPAETNIEIAAPPQPFSASQPTPSVITRMLQTKPGQPGYPIGAIRAKPFASMPDERSPSGTPPPPYRPQIFRQMNHFRPQHLFSGGGQINVESPAGSPSDKATPPPPPPYQRPPPPPRFSRGAPSSAPPPPYQSGYYGQFQEEAMPPTIYQTPYEGFEGQPAAVGERGDGSSKGFEEEGSGEFGGLVSYFSSQREDDLES